VLYRFCNVFWTFDLKMSFSRSIALLVCVTFFDHFFGAAFLGAFLEEAFFVPDFLDAGFFLEVDVFAIRTFNILIQA